MHNREFIEDYVDHHNYPAIPNVRVVSCCGLSKAYEIIHSGAIHTFRSGREFLVTGAELKRLRSSLPQLQREAA